MHGEQGALLCTAKITETVPWYDAKLYASTQVVDEARHVEVFARYLEEKLGGRYQINSHLRMLLDDIVNDSRWDMTYLGMQVMVEGLALAAFGFMHQMTEEPLLKQMLRYVMSDEARHVAFGVLSLKEVYDHLSDAEMADRQEFAFEAAIRLRDRFMQQEVWERMGVSLRDVVPLVLDPGPPAGAEDAHVWLQRRPLHIAHAGGDLEAPHETMFAFEAAVRMRDRFLQQEVWERMGVDVRTMIKLQLENQGDKNEDPFQQLLFSKIVPNCKKLGLLDRNDFWLRKKFGEMGVIQFEDWVDTGEEYEALSLEATAAESA
jgi:hypothetical protein